MLSEIIIKDQHGNNTNHKQIYNSQGCYMSTTTLDYTPVEHEAVRDTVLETLKGLGIQGTLKQVYERGGVDAHYKFTLESFGDKIKPMLEVSNSYQTGFALHNLLGAWTQVCSNGAMAFKNQADFRHVHIKDLNTQLFEGIIKHFVQDFPRHLEKLETMKAIPLLQPKVEEILKAVTLAERNQRSMFDMFYNPENGPGNRQDKSLHSLFQVTTEFFTHSKIIQERSRIQAFEKIGKVFDHELQLN